MTQPVNFGFGEEEDRRRGFVITDKGVVVIAKGDVVEEFDSTKKAAG